MGQAQYDTDFGLTDAACNGTQSNAKKKKCCQDLLQTVVTRQN